MNDIYVARLKMAFELSEFVIDLKVKYYHQKLYPDKPENEVRKIVYQEMVDFKEKELRDASRCRFWVLSGRNE